VWVVTVLGVILVGAGLLWLTHWLTPEQDRAQMATVPSAQSLAAAAPKSAPSPAAEPALQKQEAAQVRKAILADARREVLRLHKLYYSSHTDPGGEIAWENKQLKKEKASFWLTPQDAHSATTKAKSPIDPCPRGTVILDGFHTFETTEAIHVEGLAPCLIAKDTTVVGGEKGLSMQEKPSLPSSPPKQP